MTAPRLEHVNVTVADPDRTAALMETLFDWRVRWRGPSAAGRSVHVGTADHYLALYRPSGEAPAPAPKGEPLNHIGIEVDDLDATEARVLAAGLTPFSHGDYDPGRRFYFLDPDGVEYEVVSYR
jgi:catechol 2,3-dioxygenase-like lactoylglutathione lyase family enzyme